MITLIRNALFALCLVPAAQADIAVEELSTPQGIEMWFVEDHTVPIIALDIRFGGGAALDPEGKRGAAHLMTALIEEGAGERNAREFQTRREELAADFDFDIDQDHLIIKALFLSDVAPEAVELLSLAIRAPRFDEDAVERVRAQVISGLDSAVKDPRDIARRAHLRASFGDHPYGSAPEGTHESVRSLTRGDIVEINQRLVQRKRIIVTVVGDTDPQQAMAMIDELLADLDTEAPALPPRIDPAGDGELQVIDFPTPQASAIFSQGGIDMDDKDFYPAYVLNTILGAGGMHSRLMSEVREKRGLTYGVGTSLRRYSRADQWVGKFASGNEVIAQAVEVIRDLWLQTAEQGVTQEELDRAKTYLIGAYPLLFDGNGRIASILSALQIEGRSPDYIRTRNDRIRSVTLEQVNDTAQRRMTPDALSFTVVGQPEGMDQAARP